MIGLYLSNKIEFNNKFFYARQVSSNDFGELERIMKRGANEKQVFERLEISKDDLLRLFGVCNCNFQNSFDTHVIIFLLSKVQSI